MTAPYPRPPSPWDQGFLLWGGDQLAALEREMEAFRGEVLGWHRPSRAERLGRAVVAVFTETGRHLKRLRMRGEVSLWGRGDEPGEHASSAGERQ